MQKYQVNVSMDGRYNFITIFYFLTFKDPYPLEILVAIKFSSRFPFKVGTSKICFNPEPGGRSQPRQDLDLNL